MSDLSVTVIDVGWGDSIFLAWSDGTERRFGLIDSNDTVNLKPSFMFLKRYFEKEGIDTQKKPVFDFVVLSHDHSDHSSGLQIIMQVYGTQHFWYPKTNNPGALATLIRYARRRNSSVSNHEALDANKILPKLGDVILEVLWPQPNHIEPEENNNSIVLVATHGKARMVLPGDAEGTVWGNIANQLPSDVDVFKVPHHGSSNGTFLANGTPWLDHCTVDTRLAISSHVSPFSHPDQVVVQEFERRKHAYFRTDEHYHLTFTSRSGDVSVKYSHE